MKTKLNILIKSIHAKSWILALFVLSTSLLLLNSCDGDDEGTDALPKIDQSVSSIAVSANNTKWIGTATGLYQTVSGGYKFVDKLGEIQVNTIMCESDLLWVGTTDGILKVTLAGAEVKDFSKIETDKVSNPNISTSYMDASSKLWFGTNTGLSLNYDDYWKNDSFRINILGKVFPMELETMKVNSIAVLDGDYFFATSGGALYRAVDYVDSVDAFSGATQWIAPYNGYNLTSNMNVVFVDSKGNNWMGGESGIQVHKGSDPKNMEEFTFYNDELVSNLILAIAEAPDGKIWVGTDKGLSIKNGASWTTMTENLPSVYINAIAFDKEDGSAWVGTKLGLVNIK